VLGLAFVLLGGINVWLVLEAWSRVKAAKASTRMLALHRIGGYLFIALFCVMAYFMIGRIRAGGGDRSRLSCLSDHGRPDAASGRYRKPEEYVPSLNMLLAAKPDAFSAPSLDLANVTFVDRAAMLYLLCARKRNIALYNCPSYVMRWIEQESLTESGLTRPLK
jgi:hypothetical protein